MAEVLKLSTLIERPTIIIDDVSYEIMSPDELSVIDDYRLGDQGKRLGALMDMAQLNDEDERKLSDLLRRISNFIMVGVPEDIRAKLSDAMRTEIAQVFTTLPLRKHLKALSKAIDATETGAEAKPKKPKARAGAKSRRGSKGSTAGRRAGGSTMPQ